MSDKADVLVIGAGLGGLTAAALLAKRGLKVLVLERNGQPGGSCGAFRRSGYTFDLGAAMLFGFGEKGFNPHRFVMNELEEELDVYRHEAMYRLHYKDPQAGIDGSVVFWPETERFLSELGKLFPGSEGEIRSFYRDLEKLYETVISANSVFLSPSETPRRELAAGLLRHPVNEAKLLALLSKSAMSLMRRRVKDERLYKFFNKLTSTYTYTTIEETPALLAVTMFIENHIGGAYYPAGSPMMLAAKLEKALEKFGGSIRYGETVRRILVEGGRAVGAETESGESFYADEVIFGGTVWNLYEKLLPPGLVPPELLARVRNLVPSYPSSILYGAVREGTLPEGTFPVEMLIGNPERIDESDVTLYFSSLEDPSLAPAGAQVFLVIGPSSRSWPDAFGPVYRSEAYRGMKEEEAQRMLDLVEARFPGFRGGIITSCLGSPSTVEHYLLKNGGSIAGPKQKLGQELMKRQAAATFIPGLFMCGESTVMGTGTPAVTISGISAADLVLRGRGLEEYRNRPHEKQYVRIIPKGQLGNRPRAVFADSGLCQWCEDAPCRRVCPAGIDIMGIMRRLEADNALGASRRLAESDRPAGGEPGGSRDKSRLSCDSCADRPCLAACSRLGFDERSVPIPELLSALKGSP